MDASTCQLWAHEVEEALVSMLWRQPYRCAQFLRECDLGTHLSQPHLRSLVSAIDLAYRELGACDFASVVQILRELGRLEDCGGLEELNNFYVHAESVALSSQTLDPGYVERGNERIFGFYLETLKTYALVRAQQGLTHFTPARFSGGAGELEFNKLRRKDTEPHFGGQVKVAGKLYQAAVWCQGNGNLALKLVPA